jgi:hypothetical protein
MIGKEELKRDDLEGFLRKQKIKRKRTKKKD